MKPADEARRKLSTAPADMRFAILFAPRVRREALTALFAVYLEIREILHECSDAGVARIKLEWWQEEIILLTQGKPRHLLTINLSRFTNKQPLPSQLFMDIIESVAMDIAPPAFPHFEDVERYCQRRGSALLELAAVLCGARQAATLNAARQLGMTWQLAEIVLRSPVDAVRGRVYFAADDLRKHGVDRHITDGVHDDTGLKALLSDYARRTQAFADAAFSEPASEPHTLVVARVMSGLSQKRLKKIAQLDYNPTASPVELHPLAALFTAWRSAHQIARLSNYFL